MLRPALLGIALALAAVVARPALADEEYEVRWSASIEAALSHIASEEADDDVTGFFDLYEFTPNKSSDLPVALGVTEAAVDVLGVGETPRLQFRLESPTSNLGITGDQIDHPFLNQRADLHGRFDGILFDVAYRRLRTDDLRLFPDPGTSGADFFDLTDPDDRFYVERTGFDAELRLRPHELSDETGDFAAWLSPQVMLRGGAQFRDGQRQLTFSMPVTNQWTGFTREVDQSVGEVGGGLLLAPGGLFTLVLDVDHERFREDASAPLDSDLGAPFPSRPVPIGFVPDTDRTTGSARILRRFGERAVVEGGFQVSHLQQVDSSTPAQEAVGLRDNEVVHTSANIAADVALVGALSANAVFKFDRRDDQIERGTTLFNAGDVVPVDPFPEPWQRQVGPFLDDWQRMFARAELVYRLRGANLVAAGVRGEWIDRDLDFVTVDPVGFPGRILPENAQISDESESYSVYGRTVLRPFRAFSVRAEAGYREAPETGYTLDLDDEVFGELEASYTVPLDTPVVLTAFAKGNSGENDDSSWVGGLGPDPQGERVERDFERWAYRWGVTAAASPLDRVSLFTSFFHARDAQDYALVLSNVQRFLQDIIPLDFTTSGPLEYRSVQISLIAGARVELTERTDAGLSYSFTHAEATYRTNGAPNGAALRDASRVDADIHSVRLEAGHWVSRGLRLIAGYRLGYFEDHSQVSGAGAVRPFDLDTFEHTVTVGATVTEAFFD